MDMERYTQSMMLNMLLSQTFTLRFNHNMQLELEPIAKQNIVIDPTDSRSIKNLVPRIPMTQLAELAQAMIAEMGKRSLLLAQ